MISQPEQHHFQSSKEVGRTESSALLSNCLGTLRLEDCRRLASPGGELDMSNMVVDLRPIPGAHADIRPDIIAFEIAESLKGKEEYLSRKDHERIANYLAHAWDWKSFANREVGLAERTARVSGAIEVLEGELHSRGIRLIRQDPEVNLPGAYSFQILKRDKEFGSTVTFCPALSEEQLVSGLRSLLNTNKLSKKDKDTFDEIMKQLFKNKADLEKVFEKVNQGLEIQGFKLVGISENFDRGDRGRKIIRYTIKMTRASGKEEHFDWYPPGHGPPAG